MRLKFIYALVLSFTCLSFLTAKEIPQTRSYRVRPQNRYVPQLIYGKKIYQFSFYKQFNQLKTPGIYLPVTYIGIGETGRFLISRNANYYGHFSFFYITPQSIKLDSSQSKISGFLFSASLYGVKLFKRNRRQSLFLSTGINLGRLRLLNNDLLKQKNNIIAPMISMDYSRWLGKFKITLNVQYDFDISKISWQKTKFADKAQTHLNNFNQSGLITCIGMGYNF